MYPDEISRTQKQKPIPPAHGNRRRAHAEGASRVYDNPASENPLAKFGTRVCSFVFLLHSSHFVRVCRGLLFSGELCRRFSVVSSTAHPFFVSCKLQILCFLMESIYCLGT